MERETGSSGRSYTDIITGVKPPKLSLRAMTKGDLMETFLMRNDEQVLKYAQTPNPISWKEHESVFLYTDYPKYVFIDKISDVPPFEETVGYLEFRHDVVNDDPNTKIWAFHISDEHRGKGLSGKMLEEGLKEAKKLGIKRIVAVVKKNNEKSIHLHERLGFGIVKADDEEITYELNVA